MMDLQEQIVNNLYLFVGIKDKNFRYIFCSEKVAEVAGMDSPQQMIGKTDYDFIWRDRADLYRAGDECVLSGHTYLNQPELQTQIKGLAKILVSKNRVFNRSDRCIGVMFYNVDVSDFYLKRKSPEFIDTKTRFYLGPYFNNEYLTKRETEVLKDILVGYTTPQIAELLNLSTRTVETHIDKIKKKLQCRTKGDIIVTAMKTGLTYSLLDDDAWS
jgi:DNA-binding CsgD family transcriptional regulator